MGAASRLKRLLAARAIKPTSLTLSVFRHDWPAIAGSALLASTAAAAEAVALVVVAAMAAAFGSANLGAPGVDLGPLSGSISFRGAAVLAAALIAASAVGRVSANYVIIRRWTDISRKWRQELIAGFLGSTFEYQSGRRRGEVLETAGQQAAQGAQVIDISSQALNSLLTMIILIGAAFALQPVAATVLLVGGSALLLALRPFTRRARRLAARVTTADIQLGNELDEVARVASDIKLFDAAGSFGKAAGKEAERSAYLLRRVLMYNRSVPLMYQGIGLLLLVLALMVVYAAGGASIAAIGAAALLLLRGISYGQRLSSYQQNLGRFLPSVERVITQLAAYEQHTEAFGGLPIARVESIEFDNVGYAYPGGGVPALRNARFAIKEPGITGLVGPSGSGKSTLAQLLLRLRPPSDGAVVVNGINARDFAPQAWRRTVSFVPQEVELIHGTVIENVAFFRGWVSHSQVEAAISAVGLTDHIRSLPDGFDTRIGPSVRGFSGGQKQRLGIARALAGNPSLFVLDEPTSALDEESEAWIMTTLSALRTSRIVIIITHRESTQRYCDAIVQLNDGEVIAVLKEDSARNEES